MGRRLLRPLPFQLLAWPLLPQHDRAALIEANDVSSGSAVREISQSKASNEVWPSPPRTTGVMSGFVQVFGRRDADTIHALLQPASKKRQGTKSREVCGQRVPRALWGFCRRFGLVEVGLKRSPRSACGEPWWHASV